MTPRVLPELRCRQFWLAAGLLMIAVITVVCLVPADELPGVGLSDKTEHVLAFGALAFWFGCILLRRSHFALALSLVAFGGLIEVAQGAMGWGRSADIRDFVADAIGVGAGLLLASTPLARWVIWFDARLVRAMA